MTPAETAKITAVLMLAYPDRSFALYERLLADLDYATTNAAIERLVATSKWPPTIAEIREAALALVVGELRPGGEAWGDVLHAIGTYGNARTPGVHFDFGDPIVAQCVTALKWRELCLSENQAADRARFIELYDRAAATQRRSMLSESLPAVRRLRAAADQPAIATANDAKLLIGELAEKLKEPQR